MSPPSDTNLRFKSENLETISKFYMNFHGYFSLFICCFGISTNIINIKVLTRKHMQTPINFILTWMAVSDILTMCSYVPFALHFYCVYPPQLISAEKNSIQWMSFLLFHINFTATTHTISIWLGVSLAIFRYIHIQSPAKGSLTRMRRKIRARIVVCVIYIGSVVILIPNYISNTLVPFPYKNGTYVLEDFKLGTPDVKPVVLLNLFLYSSVAKFLPCILMIVYIGLLLRTLNKTLRGQRRRLFQKGISSQCHKTYDTSKTTLMLVVVIVLFLITELPQAVLVVLSLFLRGFFEHIYIPLGDAMDIIALINNSINFVLYCSMSSQFRLTLKQLVYRHNKYNKHPYEATTITHSTSVVPRHYSGTTSCTYISLNNQ